MEDGRDRDVTKVLVRSMHHESAGVLGLHLEPLDGQVAEWTPGAHIDLRLGGLGARQYSLCGEPGDRYYRIAVLREAASRGASECLHREVRPGDIIEIGRPRNHFVLEDAPEYVLVAGGIGITPLMPMITRLVGQGRPWALHYQGRSRSSMAFLRELEAHGDAVHVYPRDEVGRPSLRSIVSAASPDALVYACGPAGLLQAVQEVLGDGDRLRTELFEAPVDAAVGPLAAFAVELTRSGLVLDVPDDRSILEVVTAAGVEVVSDCETGICGSCETKVVAGEPEHRDHVLTSRERLANDCMMICVSRALGPRLVLEL